MKKLILFTLFVLFTSLYSIAQIEMDVTGNVGIGIAPNTQYKLDISDLSRIINLKSSTISGVLKLETHTGMVLDQALEIKPAVMSSYCPMVEIAGSTNKGYHLYVGGNSYSTGSWIGSDAIFKKDISSIGRKNQSILKKLKKIDGKVYTYKSKEELRELYDNGTIKFYYNSNDSVPQFNKGRHYGLIAQDLVEEFPELVWYDSATLTMSVNYNGMIPILLAAIKEQQSLIEELQQEILDDKNSSLSDSYDKTLGVERIESKTKPNCILYQNTPNPFYQSTVINYYISENSNSAMINIYDLNGTQLSSIKINELGKGSITVNGGDYKAGMYIYTLIVDSQIIDSKQMILTD